MLNAIIQFQTAKSLENGQKSMKEVKKSFHKVSAYQITFKQELLLIDLAASVFFESVLS